VQRQCSFGVLYVEGVSRCNDVAEVVGGEDAARATMLQATGEDAARAQRCYKRLMLDLLESALSRSAGPWLELRLHTVEADFVLAGSAAAGKIGNPAWQLDAVRAMLPPSEDEA
jgi:hypothetical protein